MRQVPHHLSVLGRGPLPRPKPGTYKTGQESRSAVWAQSNGFHFRSTPLTSKLSSHEGRLSVIDEQENVTELRILRQTEKCIDQIYTNKPLMLQAQCCHRVVGFWYWDRGHGHSCINATQIMCHTISTYLLLHDYFLCVFHVSCCLHFYPVNFIRLLHNL